MAGRPGTPGPVMLLINSATPTHEAGSVANKNKYVSSVLLRQVRIGGKGNDVTKKRRGKGYGKPANMPIDFEPNESLSWSAMKLGLQIAPRDRPRPTVAGTQEPVAERGED